MFKIAIVGTGNMARTMCMVLKRMPDVKCQAVVSESIQRAQSFAQRYKIPESYEGVSSLLDKNRTDVDLVYIATRNPDHVRGALQCIESGMPVLVEKPLTISREDTFGLLAAAQKKKSFLEEAMVIRYSPLVSEIKSAIECGEIGTITGIAGNISIEMMNLERVIRPELGGGCLFDIGIYLLHFFQMFSGGELKEYKISHDYMDTGVDKCNRMVLTNDQGIVGVLRSSMETSGSNQGFIIGIKGYIVIEHIYNFSEYRVYSGDKCIRKKKMPRFRNGYEYEIRACMRAIQEGKTECRELPHRAIEEVYSWMFEFLKKESYK